jgi:transcriptional regulator with XRE-family HTH domain
MSSPEALAPSRARKRLGAELRTARTLAGMNQTQLGNVLDRTQGVVSRIEAGQRLLTIAETRAWLQAVRADEDTEDRVLALTEAVHAETSLWSNVYGGRAHLQDVIGDRDRQCTVVRNFQPTVLPGLLQTVDYARAVLRIADGQAYEVPGVDRAAALAGRIGRQEILREPGRTFQFVFVEGLLHKEPEAGVLRAQLNQLLTFAELDTVELAVLPASYMGTMPWHNFVLRHPAADDGAPYVTAELLHGSQTVRDPDSVGVYRRLWDRLWEAAARGDDALAMIREAA